MTVAVAAAWLAGAVLLGGCVGAGEGVGGTARGYLFKTIEHEGRAYPYVVYVPRQYEPGEAMPVILFLHGRGETGTDGSKAMAQGLPKHVAWDAARWPFIIAMPQKPEAEPLWTAYEGMALAVLDRVMADYNADPSRVYLTGLSQGGYGAWRIGAEHAARFAAVAPVCGYITYPFERGRDAADVAAGDPEARRLAAALAETPVWIFHGAQDDVVPPVHARAMAEALRGAGGRVRLTVYEGVGHDAWDPAYTDPALPAWLLSHRLER